MKKVILISLLTFFYAEINQVSAKTIYGWCGAQATVPEDYTRAEIAEMQSLLDAQCDESNGYTDDEEDPEDPDIPDGEDKA